MSRTASPGRNDPCFCGSGRKYKHCCLGAQSNEDSARLRIRRAEGGIVDTLVPYIGKTWGAEFFHAAWREFFLWNDVPEDMTGTHEFETMFLPWLTTLYIPDPEGEETEPDWPVTPVATHWLAHERTVRDAYDRQWIEAACRSPLSAFVVEDVVAGRSVDLKDILTGRGFHVLEQGASQTLKKHDISFTRVVTVEGVSVMFGATPWVMRPEWHTVIIDWREGAHAGSLMTRGDLEECDFEIRDLYLDIVARILNPAPPRLQNTDGDPLALTTLTFSVDGTVDEVAGRLAALARLPDDEPGEDVLEDTERDAAGALTRAVVSWKKAGNKKNKSWTNTILGTLRVTPGRIVAEVNSEKRAKRCARELRKLLGAPVTLLNTEVVDPFDAMATRGAHGARTGASGGASLDVRNGSTQSPAERPGDARRPAPTAGPRGWVSAQRRRIRCKNEIEY